MNTTFREREGDEGSKFGATRLPRGADDEERARRAAPVDGHFDLVARTDVARARRPARPTRRDGAGQRKACEACAGIQQPMPVKEPGSCMPTPVIKTTAPGAADTANEATLPPAFAFVVLWSSSRPHRVGEVSSAKRLPLDKLVCARHVSGPAGRVYREVAPLAELGFVLEEDLPPAACARMAGGLASALGETAHDEGKGAQDKGASENHAESERDRQAQNEEAEPAEEREGPRSVRAHARSYVGSSL